MKIGMLFPGYSSQFVGMGKELYDESRVIQEYFEEAYNCLNLNFIKLCFASSDAELSKVSNAYTSIFLLSTALFEFLKENDVKANVVAGYGIGQYSALFASGSLTFPDGLYLLKKLAAFFEENVSQFDIVVLKIDDESFSKIKKICNGFESLHVNAYINKKQSILSGKKSEIELLKNILKNNKIKFQVVDIAFGLNSKLMIEMINQYKLYLEKVDFKDCILPFISSIDAKEILIQKKIKDFLIKQMSMPIRWDKVTDKFEDVDLIIEIGPGNSLASLIKEKYPDKNIISFNKKSDFDEIKKIINSFNKSENIAEVNNDGK